MASKVLYLKLDSLFYGKSYYGGITHIRFLSSSAWYVYRYLSFALSAPLQLSLLILYYVNTDTVCNFVNYNNSFPVFTVNTVGL